MLMQVLDISNARLTGSIHDAWLDSSARAAAVHAMLPPVQAAMQASPQIDLTAAVPVNQIQSEHALEIAAAPTTAVGAATPAAATAAAKVEPSIAAGLSQLMELRLGGNNLSGSIPNSIKAWVNVRVLDLSGNNIGGQDLAKLATLSKLQVGHIGRVGV
jgi:hypothetical protein